MALDPSFLTTNFVNPAYATPEQTAALLAQAKALQTTDQQDVKSPLQGFSNLANALVGGLVQRKALNDQASARADASSLLSKALMGNSSAAGSSGIMSATPAPSNMASGGTSQAISSDPVSTDIDPQNRALLNAIAAPESSGAYNARYSPNGGATFSDYSQHPAIFEQGPAGPSSAAGRYQFTKTTWDSLPPEAKGDGSFSPQNQDKAALWLAQRDYQARTGRNLDSDLRTNGFTPQIAQALAPTWAGLKDNPAKAFASYTGSLKRYDQQQDAQQDQELGFAQQPTVANSLPDGSTMVGGKIVQEDPRLKVERAQAANGQPAPVQVASLPPQTMTDAAPAAAVPTAPAAPSAASGSPAFASPSYGAAERMGLGPSGPSLAGQPLAFAQAVPNSPIPPAALPPPVAAPAPVQTAALNPATTAAPPSPAAPASDPSDPPVKVDGYSGTWTRASAAAAKAANAEEYPEPDELAAAQKASAGGAPAQTAAAQPTAAQPAPAASPAPTNITPPAQAATQAAPASPARSQFSNADLLAVINHPYATPEMKQIAAAVLQKQMAGNQPISLAPGTTLYDPNTGKAIFTAPTKDTDEATVVGGKIVNKRTGQVIYNGDDKDQKFQTFTDPAGNTYAWNPADPTKQPVKLTPPDANPGYSKTDQFKPGDVIIGPDKKPSVLNSGGTTVNVGDKANSKLDTNIIDDIQSSKAKAVGALGTLEAISRQRQALDGGMLTGAGANWQLQGRAVLAKLLGIPDDDVSNTQVFEAAAKQKGADLAKGISNSGHTTNADLLIGQAIAGGDITKMEKAIRATIDAQETLAQETIRRHNQSVDKFKQIMPDVANRADWYKVDPNDFTNFQKAAPPAPNRTKSGIQWSVSP